MTGTLVFDSWKVGAQIGTRGTTTEDRTLLFRFGDLCVDVNLQPLREAGGFLYGQVVQEPSGEPVADAAVHLESEADAARTDDLGQFSVAGSSGVLVIVTSGEQLRCVLPGEDA